MGKISFLFEESERLFGTEPFHVTQVLGSKGVHLNAMVCRNLVLLLAPECKWCNGTNYVSCITVSDDEELLEPFEKLLKHMIKEFDMDSNMGQVLAKLSRGVQLVFDFKTDSVSVDHLDATARASIVTIETTKEELIRLPLLHQILD